MKSRFLKTVLLAGFIVGAIWLLFNRDQIRNPGDVVKLIQSKIEAVPIHFGSESNPPNHAAEPGQFNQPELEQGPVVTNVIRIASFKLNRNITLPNSDHALGLIADICRRYDAIAFQEIDGGGTTWLSRLTDRLNEVGAAGSSRSVARTGRSTTKYTFISDQEHNAGQSTQSAIVFNQHTLLLDQSQWYTVNDPDDVLSREPLVAWFRARGPSAESAFTFTLANVKIDTDRPDLELGYLGELFRAIRNDGRHEDDVLIVGDFNAGDRGLHPLRKRAGLTWVVSNRPTDTLNQSQFDNLVFSESATVEFTGRGGVYDFMRQYNLRLGDALNISQHMPVWAEFSVFEGQAPPLVHTPGRVASRPE